MEGVRERTYNQLEKVKEIKNLLQNTVKDREMEMEIELQRINPNASYEDYEESRERINEKWKDRLENEKIKLNKETEILRSFFDEEVKISDLIPDDIYFVVQWHCMISKKRLLTPLYYFAKFYGVYENKAEFEVEYDEYAPSSSKQGLKIYLSENDKFYKLKTYSSAIKTLFPYSDPSVFPNPPRRGGKKCKKSKKNLNKSKKCKKSKKSRKCKKKKNLKK